jgi:streptomycin 6-kinase
MARPAPGANTQQCLGSAHHAKQIRSGGTVSLLSVPTLDDELRKRLAARFGDDIDHWLAELPDVLADLATRWHMRWGPVIQRGSTSVVIRCALQDGRPAVLKVSPDHARVATEGAALQRWDTIHTPSVLAVDETAGALLMEAITPGTALVESSAYPEIEVTASLLTALRASGVPDPTYPPLSHRVAHLFASGSKPYSRHPELCDVVPIKLYERGRELATRLAGRVPPTGLLHGDLTPSNILDGGAQRGLVAIDPAPCLGDDPGFDAIDLLLWQATDVDTIAIRTELLAPSIGTDSEHLFEWCIAFAGMTALELAEMPGASAARVRTYVILASQQA